MSIFLWILGGVVLVFSAMLIYTRIKLRAYNNVKEHENIINLNDSNFNQQIKSGITVVDFWATWCMPCKVMVPVLNELSIELKGKVKVCKLDVDKAKSTSARFSIRSIPTLIIFKNGKEMKRVTGVKSKAAIMAELEKYL
jgi:thioredoxin 1